MFFLSQVLIGRCSYSGALGEDKQCREVPVADDAGVSGNYLDASLRSPVLDPADYGAEGAKSPDLLAGAFFILLYAFMRTEATIPVTTWHSQSRRHCESSSPCSGRSCMN